MTNELNNEALAVIEKVKKLLALAQGNANEHEAEAATAKAMDLLAAYNLDMAMIGKTAKGSQRKDNKLKGGLYAWQRDLWKSVAELNFCMYWSIKGLTRGSTYEHRILGREENVISAQIMAEYLQQTVERMAREYAKRVYPGKSIFIKPMIAFREGMAYGLSQRLKQMRQDRIEAEERAARERAAASNHPGAASDGKGLVLMDVIHTEEDYNTDYLYGLEPGTTAKRRAEREARRIAAQAAADEKLRQQEEWDAAHPEEAAARKAKEKKELDDWWKEYQKKQERNARRRKGTYRDRKPTAREERMMMGEFHDGRDKAQEVGLDRQVDEDRRHRLGR